MSRPSWIWILLWIVLAALGVTVWQVFQNPDKPMVQSPPVSDVEAPPGTSEPPSSVQTVEESPTHGTLEQKDLLKSLPGPQSPPARLSARAKKQWLEDLTSLIDDAAYLDDEASLRMLIVEFRNPEPGIAEAARESLLARADKKALPYLLEMQDLNLNSDKQRQIEEMVGFLSKKSVFEHMRSKDP